ncbi:AMP-binding protein [Rhodococcus pyridinivorans]
MIYRPRTVELDVPSVSLSEYVLRDADKRGEKIALVDGVTGRSISYAQLDALSARGAAGLAAHGIQPGDVVALASHNCPDFAVAVYAILRAGATVTLLNPILTVHEMTKQLAHSGTKVVICTPEIAQKVAAACDETGVRSHFVIGEDTGSGAFESLLKYEPRTAIPGLNPATALAALPYSSGTTGMSKGVMLTHRNLVANLAQVRSAWNLDETDVVCAALPFFHIYGFTIILNSTLVAGGTIVTLPQFDLRTYLGVVEQYGVTFGHLAPPLVLALAAAPEVDDYDLSSMRKAVSGAAPLDEDAVARAEARTGIVIRQGYGMTEASPGTHCVHIDDFERTPSGSVGRLLPATEARIVDPVTEDDAPLGQRGELWVRGPQVMAGYLDNADATTTTITDGWLRTGDIAVVDGEDFFIVDRLKELIKYKGYQIAPAELEAVLLNHHLVSDAAVIGIPHPSGGEAPKAFVVSTGDLSADELIAWVSERVAPYKKVRAVAFVDQIPKSPAGKILRRVLKEDSAQQNVVESA